jgi:hypothetical protein
MVEVPPPGTVLGLAVRLVMTGFVTVTVTDPVPPAVHPFASVTLVTVYVVVMAGVTWSVATVPALIA